MLRKNISLLIAFILCFNLAHCELKFLSNDTSNNNDQEYTVYNNKLDIYQYLTSGKDFKIAYNQVPDLKPGIVVDISFYNVESAVHYFLPKVQKTFENFYLKPINTKINAKVVNVNISIPYGNIKLENIKKENVRIRFKKADEYNGDHIALRLEKIKGKATFDVLASALLISTGIQVEATIKNLAVSLRAEVNAAESKKYRGKLIPKIKITWLFIDNDLDIKITGGIVGFMDYLFRQNLNDLIKQKISKDLSDYIQTNSEEIFEKALGDYAVYTKVYGENIYLDNSLTGAPRIENNFLSIGIDGTIFDKIKNPDGVVPYEQNENLPFLKGQSKNGVNGFISNYTVNTLIYAASLNGLLKFTFSSEIIPESSFIKLNSTNLNILLNGLVDLVGENKPIIIDCKVVNVDSSKENLPIIDLNEGNMKTDLPVLCSFFADLSEKKPKPSDSSTESSESSESSKKIDDKDKKFVLDMTVKLKAHIEAKVKDQGKLELQIKDIKFENAKVEKSDLKNVSLDSLLQLLNFGSQIAIPIINNKILKEDVTIPLPKIDGIDYSNTEIYVKEGYIELSANPVFDHNKDKEKKDKEKDKEKDKDKKSNY